MARQGRAGAALGIAAFGSFIAGVLVDHRAVRGRPRARGLRARLRSRGIHRAGAARPAAGHAAVVGLADRRAADGGVRAAALDRRQGPDLRHRALHLPHFQPVRRAQHRAPGDGRVRRRRASDHGRRRQRGARKPVAQPKRLIELLPNRADWRASCAADPARNRARIFPRPAARRRRHAVVVHLLRAGAAAGAARPNASAMARSRASPGRNPPTTRRRSRRSCRC